MKHCPTSEMIVDYYTKPLQGKQFYNLRSIIMGHKNMEIKERVGEKVIPSILKNNLKRSNENGKNKIQNDRLLNKAKNGSITKVRERSEQMSKEDANGEESRNMVLNELKKCTYAEALLKGTGKEKEKSKFNI